MATRYQKLTRAGESLKDELRVCVDNARLIADLEEERQDMERMGLSEERELREQIRVLRSEMEEKRSQANEMIRDTASLTSLERRILRLRYLCADPWESIVCRVNRERGSVFSSYRRALNKLAERKAS